jgi:hypothetical protein
MRRTALFVPGVRSNKRLEGDAWNPHAPQPQR